MAEKRRVFSPEFKKEAVELAANSQKSAAQIAADLGIAESLIYRGRKQLNRHAGDAFPGKGNLLPQDEELRKLKMELEQLRQERDILKKALVIFSQPPNPK